MIEAARNALQTKRELLATVLLANRSAVLIGERIVFFDPRDKSHATVTRPPLDYASISDSSRKAVKQQNETGPNKRQKSAVVELNTGLLLPRDRKVIPVVAKPVETGRPSRNSQHEPSCKCFVCRDNRKWEQGFEDRYGESMRAYYGPR